MNNASSGRDGRPSGRETESAVNARGDERGNMNGAGKNHLLDAHPETTRAHNGDEFSPPVSSLGTTPPSPFRMRCDSMTASEDGDQNESKVLVIYTGGTIGMIRNGDDSTYNETETD